MIRRLLALVVALLALSGATTAPIHSIKPLQYKHAATGELVIACSTWATAINGFPFYVAALHCVSDEEGTLLEDTEWYIDGKRAYLHAGNAQLDLVMLRGGPKARPLVVAFGQPSVRTPIWTAGYLHHGVADSHALHVTAGTVSVSRDFEGKTAYDMAVKPGMSGAPVMLDDGVVVGMVQQHECPQVVSAWCPVSRGIRVDQLRLFLYGE